MDLDYIVSIVMLGLLGMFLLAIIGGILFGMLRGWRRTGKRMLTLLGFFVFALLITPLVSRIVLATPLGRLLRDLIDGALGGEDGTVAVAMDTMGDIRSFLHNLPIVIINILVFWVLFIMVRFVFAPIFSRIFLKKFAPKYECHEDGTFVLNDENEKVKKETGNIWAGIGMGALQGAIIFAFFFIPVLGVLSILNRIDNYEPSIAGRTVDFFNRPLEDDGDVVGEDDESSSLVATLGDFNQAVRDLNTSIKSESFQGTAIWGITRFTGMQALGNFGLGYFSRVRAGSTTVNLRNDIEVAFELTRDFVVLYDLILDTDDAKDLIPVFSDDANVRFMRRVVNKAFDMGLVRLFLNSDFAEFMREEDMLDDMDAIDDLVDDAPRFRESIYTGVGHLNANFVRHDLLSAIELMRLVFAEHQYDLTTDVSLFRDIDNMLLVFNATIDAENPFTVDGVNFNSKRLALEHVFNNVHRALTQIEITTGRGSNETTRNLAHEIAHVFANMNIFQRLLMDANNPDLHAMIIANLLDMEDVDARIDDFGRVIDGLASIVIRVVEVGPTVYRLTEARDIVGFARVLNENDGAAIDAIGEILEILTNRGDAYGMYNGNQVMGLGNILRTFIANTVTEQFSGDDSGSVITFDAVLAPLVNMLSPDGPDIAWAYELRHIIYVVEGLGGILTGDVNPDELVNALLDGSLLNRVANSQILSDIVVGIFDSAVNDMLEDTGLQFNFDGVSDTREVVRAMGALSQAIGSQDVTEWMEDLGNEEFNDVQDIIDLFGTVKMGEEGNEEEVSVIVLLAESGVRMEIDTGEESVISQEDVDAFVEALPENDPLRIIALLFVFK